MPCSLLLILNRERKGWSWDMVRRAHGQPGAICQKIPIDQSASPFAIISSLDYMFEDHSKIVDRERIKEWGNEIWHSIFPQEIKYEIERAEGGDIFFRVPLEWADIPFELCYIRNRRSFLSEIFWIGTEIVLQPEDKGIGRRCLDETPYFDKILIIADPAGNRASAYREGIELKKLADKYKIDHKVINRELSSEIIIDQIIRYPIAHFAGESDDTGNPDTTGWQIGPEDTLFNLHDIEKLRGKLSVPCLIFSNSCDASKCGCDSNLQGIAGAFLKAGVSQVIAPIKKVNDTEASEFAKSFYNDLFKEEHPIPSSSLLAAKQELQNKNPDSTNHLLYRLFGDPWFGIKHPPNDTDNVNNWWKKVLVILLLISIIVGISIIGYFRTIRILCSFTGDEYVFFKKTMIQFCIKNLMIPIIKNTSPEELLMNLREKKEIDIAVIDINILGDILIEEELQYLPDPERTFQIPDFLKTEELFEGQEEKRNYLIPFRLNVRNVFVNKPKIEKFYGDPNRVPESLTYQIFYEFAKEIKNQQGVKRAIIPAYDKEAPLFLLELIRIEGDPENILHESSIESIKFLHQLLSYVKLGDWKSTIGDLIAGWVYIAPSWSFTIRELEKENVLKNFKVYPGLIWEKNSSPHNLLGGDFLVVPKNALHKELALKVIKFLLSPEVQKRLAEELYWVPIRGTILTQLKENNIYFQKINEALENAKPVPSWWNECVREVYSDLFNEIKNNSNMIIDKEFLHPYQIRLEECIQ